MYQFVDGAFLNSPLKGNIYQNPPFKIRILLTKEHSTRLIQSVY